ncbi:MAG: FAD/NAD(P)-binding oxidoreductase [bacterium]|nr:FAD/NAD(P)-binding oxidoreductase [bacterium]
MGGIGIKSGGRIALKNLEYDYLIIGGGIAGTTAAETIRRRDAAGKIAIVEDEPHLLYSRVFLPAYARGELGREKVMLRGLKDYERQNIDLFVSERILKIDFSRREAATASGKNFFYKKLLVASGGRVRPWEFEKEFADRILRLQTLEDAERIRSLAFEGKIKKVAVVGGGFISLEFLNIFKKYGVELTLILRADYFWKGQVDDKGGEFFKELFSRNAVAQLSRDELYEIRRVGNGIQVLTKNGNKIECDYIAAGLGLKRNNELVEGQLETGRGIKVNEFLEAKGQERVWAAGDVVEYFDKFSGRDRMVGNWTHGFMTGHIAGENMAGGRKSFASASTYSITALSSVLTFVGDVEEDAADETVTRFLPAERKYSRFFLKRGRLIGAILFNTYQLKPILSKLIESEKDLSAQKHLFRDVRGDLSLL